MSLNESDDIAQSKQRIGGIFGRAALTYDQVGPPFFPHFGKRLVDIAKISPGSKVLDVATGRGALLFPAGEAVGQSGHVVGIDLAETMVQETFKELAHRKMPPNIEVRQMDAEDLQFPDESFDHLFCGFAIFFFPQLSRAMSEFRRVLKPNGRICISTWDKSFDEQWSWFDEIVRDHLPPPSESTQPEESNATPQPVFDTPEGLESILASAGFENIQIFSEEKEFVYSTKEEYWLSLWSHGMRGLLERIEQVNGKDGLEKFKSDVFRKIDILKKDDGLHRMFSALVGLATKPQS
jgi:ubiquinone/menaquinone biosynthesis C-methylase UbiE